MELAVDYRLARGTGHCLNDLGGGVESCSGREDIVGVCVGVGEDGADKCACVGLDVDQRPLRVGLEDAGNGECAVADRLGAESGLEVLHE